MNVFVLNTKEDILKNEGNRAVFFLLLLKSMVPQNNLIFKLFFKISPLCSDKHIHTGWIYLKVSKWWQNFHFWVNYPFKICGIKKWGVCLMFLKIIWSLSSLSELIFFSQSWRPNCDKMIVTHSLLWLIYQRMSWITELSACSLKCVKFNSDISIMVSPAVETRRSDQSVYLPLKELWSEAQSVRAVDCESVHKCETNREKSVRISKSNGQISLVFREYLYVCCWVGGSTAKMLWACTCKLVWVL